ncbi:MAG: type I polyketide synthase [Caldilineaceae bacterium]
MSQPSETAERRRLLFALNQAAEKIKAFERAQHEPIAIIGMACRFPGGANDPAAYWRLLADGVDAITPISPARWPMEDYYDPDPDAPGKMYIREAGLLDDIEQFDPQFFGISPREAARIDPQHRLLLEVSWEALEHAGQSKERLLASSTGVFIGITTNEYGQLLIRDPRAQLDSHLVTGNTLNAAAGRLAYTLGLTGPALAIDTACSSSLVALHQACQSLRLRECDQALAGGVNLILSPEIMIALCKAQILATDGRCRTFDAAAKGIARGEGCGMVVLKRLTDAQADGDNILALIRGSAVNQDGPSSGLTVPNGMAQEALIRQALANAQVKPAEIDYVEAHGTGTALGDPIEVRALGAVLGEARTAPLLIGAVKTNLGHLESAAGIAGLIKLVLAFQQEALPPHIHLREPNPYIDWARLPVKVVTERTAWPQGVKQRLAGLSGFGLSGTNAHLILEEAPAQEPPSMQSASPALQLFTLSAKTKDALTALAHRYAHHWAEHPAPNWADVAFTANTGRLHFPHRLSLVAQTTAEARAMVAAFAEGTDERVGMTVGAPTGHPKIAFLFTGQGSQYVGMGRQLYESQPVFRQALETCDQLWRRLHSSSDQGLPTSLLALLYPDQATAADVTQGALDQTAFTQPALFAIEYALAKLWMAWGIQPDLVLGHSVGEYVAACIAGVFSLEDGLRLIAERGRLMQALPPNGAMVALFASEPQVNAALHAKAETVSIAAVNGPQHVVISGAREAIQHVVDTLAHQGIKSQALKVSHAFHSPLMEPMLAAFARVAQQVQYAAPQIPFVSNLTGQLERAAVTTANYWVRHVRQPVRFADGMQTLDAQGVDIFLEIGPKPILLGMGRHCLPETRSVPALAERMWLPSLRQDREESQQMLTTLGALYVRGAEIDWTGFYHQERAIRRKVVLPTYPFQRQRYWLPTAKQTHAAVSHHADTPVQAPTPIVDWLTQGQLEPLTNLLRPHLQAEQMAALPAMLAALAQAHQRQLTAGSMPGWLYQLAWQPQAREQVTEGPFFQAKGSWLIVADQGGIGQTLATRLTEEGQQALLVQAAALGLQATADDPAWLSARFTALLQEAKAKGPLKGVLYMGGLDEVEPAEQSPAWLAQTQAVLASVLHLFQAVVSEGEPTTRMWVVTGGAVEPSLRMVAQAPLWGLGRVAALEHPERWGGLIDMTPGTPVAALLAELAAAEGETQIALHGAARRVARLVRLQAAAPKPTVTFAADATYLITGGLGALGLQIARLLIDEGAKHVVLTGRNGAASPDAQAAVNELKATGADVTVIAADVANWQDVVKLFRQLDGMPPLRGIVHAAGVLDDGLLLKQSGARFAQVLAPKVQGSWHLHQLSQGLPLDFFVCFSSAASLLGSPGQGNYAAANAFMDALAHYRRSLGLPALTINWGPWAEAGMAVQSGTRQQARLAALGVTALSAEQGKQVFLQLLASQATQVGVLPIDWALFAQGAGRSRPFLAQVLDEAGAQDTTPEASQTLGTQQAGTALWQWPAQAEKRQTLLSKRLQEEVALVLEAPALPPVTEGFFKLGMDSLMAVELKKRLERRLGIELPATLAFEYPTVAALADYLYAEIFADVLPEEQAILAMAPQAQVEAFVAEATNGVQELSPEELMAQIAAEFDSYR